MIYFGRDTEIGSRVRNPPVPWRRIQFSIKDSGDGSNPKKPKVTVSEDGLKIHASDPASFLAGVSLAANGSMTH